jgi:hypothetical protein
LNGQLKAGFPYTVPYTEILFPAITPFYWRKNRFGTLTGIFPHPGPVFFGKCSGSLRGGFGSSRRIPEETPKKSRRQPGRNPAGGFTRNGGQTAPKFPEKKFPYTVPNSEIWLPGTPIFVGPVKNPNHQQCLVSAYGF